jgi:O-antigen/teichoic acid export membrane protein
MTQAIAATTLLILPSMSQDLGRGNVARLRKKAILSTVFLTTLAILFVAGLFLFAGPLDRLLFGQKYSSSAWLMPVLGLVPVFTGFSASLSLALRALRKSQFELLAYALSATSALASALLLMPRWGLAGAAASIVGSTAVLAMAVLVCFLKWGKG